MPLPVSADIVRIGAKGMKRKRYLRSSRKSFLVLGLESNTSHLFTPIMHARDLSWNSRRYACPGPLGPRRHLSAGCRRRLLSML